MKQCTKEVEIELEDGTLIEGTLKVSEFLDEGLNQELADKPQSLIGSWSFAHEEELDEDQQANLDEKVEEMVFAEKWDFENGEEIEDDEEEME